VLTDVERLRRLFSEQVETLFHSRTVVRRAQVFVALAQLRTNVIQCYVLPSIALNTTTSISIVNTIVTSIFCLQCFDAVGWVPGRASGL